MKTVLVVDDSVTDSQVMTLYLKQAGLNVVAVTSVSEAKQKLNQINPDLIILDVILPDQSGFEMCRELKSSPTTSKIPVIISSTKGTDVDKMWGNMLGAEAYLPKPVDQTELLSTLKKLINV